jgi:cytochrome c-type biogenesis protein
MVRLDSDGEPYHTNFDMVKGRISDNKPLAGTALVLVIVLIVIASTMTGGSSDAPDFEAQWVNSDGSSGEQFTNDDLAGKTIVLDLMSTTCGPCKDVAENTLKPLHEKYASNENVLIISLSVGGDSAEELHSYSVDNGFEWLHAIDVDSSVFTAFSAKSIPIILVINGDGEIVFHEQGNSIPMDEIETAIETADSAVGISSGSGSIWAMAIGAGALSFFSPCSFPLLPGYVSYYLAKETEAGTPKNMRVKKAFPAGVAASVGILSVFLGLALLIIPFSQAVKELVQTLIPITAVFIFLMGVVMITDYDISWLTRPFQNGFNKFFSLFKKEKPIVTENDGLSGQFLYGVGYGAASAGCTAPVFIALLMASMKYTILGAVAIFTLYSVSTAVLMITFTMLAAASQDTLVNKMKASTGVIKKTGGGIMLVVGVYLIWEYFTIWMN